LGVEGKESGGDVFAGRRGFHVWRIRVVVPRERGSRGWRSTEEGFPHRGGDNIDVGIFYVEESERGSARTAGR